MAYRTLGTDRIMELGSCLGTGAVTLNGAVTGFRTFASVLASGDTVTYWLEAVDNNGLATGPWERGYGTFTTGPNTLARTVVLSSSAGGSTPANLPGTVRIGTGPIGETTASFYPVPGGRLSISTNPIADGSTTGSLIYYVPFLHDKIPLWNGGGIQVVTIPAAGVSVNMSGFAAGNVVDIFGYLSGNTLALTMLSWGALTTRGTPLTMQNGFWCQSGAPGNRYLGTFYNTSAGVVYDTQNTGTTGQPAKRLLWNMYNRVAKPFYMCDQTASWTYQTSTWRIIRGQAAPQGCVEMVRGMDEEAVTGLAQLAVSCPNGAGTALGIGLDGVSTIPFWAWIQNGNAGNYQGAISVPFSMITGAGYHYLAMGEYSQTGAATTIGWNIGTCGILGTLRA
jgi:hypothetical protein